MPNEIGAENDLELQRLMYIICELLGMYRRSRQELSGLDGSRRIAKHILAMTQGLEFLTAQRIRKSEETSEVDFVTLCGMPLCDQCLAETIEKRRTKKVTFPGANPAPIWKRSLEFALSQTDEAASEVFNQHCATYSVHQIPGFFAKLRAVLCRVHDLLPPETTGPNIKCENEAEICAVCGKGMLIS
jgi:hypothetical protein